MKLLCLYASVLAFLVALALCWPEPLPREHGYTVKSWCAEHQDVCKRGIRTVLKVTPTPIPQKGFVVITP